MVYQVLNMNILLPTFYLLDTFSFSDPAAGNTFNFHKVMITETFFTITLQIKKQTSLSLVWLTTFTLRYVSYNSLISHQSNSTM